jgi:hypothetical protein
MEKKESFIDTSLDDAIRKSEHRPTSYFESNVMAKTTY